MEFLDEAGTVDQERVTSDDATVRQRRRGCIGTPGTCVTRCARSRAARILAGGSLRGPLAVPGTYQVRLIAGGATLVEPLRIVAPAHSEASTADLRKQFDLLIAIRDKVTRGARRRERHPQVASGAAASQDATARRSIV